MRTALLAAAVLFSIARVSTAAPQRVRLSVRVPANTPADAVVFVAGSLPAVGSWKADGLKLTRQADGTYAADLELDAGQTLEFKFNRGDWSTVEKRADGNERENRTANIDATTRQIDAVVERWADGAAQTSTVVGTLRLIEIDSANLKQKRTVRVWLPPGYDASADDRYDVLYLHDGQNCFDRATGFGGQEWGVDETLTGLIGEKKIRPLIVVGVDNAGPDRTSEYTFVADAKEGGGRGETYARFLLDEVRPLIDRTFRTRTGKANTFVGGSSLGALVSLEIARRHSDVFGGVLAMSPSVWWSDSAIAKALEQDATGLVGTKVWLDVGTRELATDAAAASTVADAKRVDAALTRHKIEHRFVVDDGAQHNEAAWAKRFPQAIAYLLGDD